MADASGTRRGFFWVGVERRKQSGGHVARGQMYVCWEAPARARRPYPIVLIHGGGGQGTDWLGTPDGRSGWATFLVEEGYTVYVVDRPGHGRSPFHPDVLAPMGPPPTYEFLENLFTPPPEGPGSHPTSHLHTRWPRDGEHDSAVIDQLVANMGPMLSDLSVAHALERTRGAELLDRIGPAILMTHSAGGPAGWVMADARPGLVKAIVAIETLGPPFFREPSMGISLDWGLAAAPLTFDPPVSSPSELSLVTHASPAPGVPPLTLQAEPARTLTHLARMPIAAVYAEASRFVHIASHTVEFLKQAGCDVDLVRLADHGVHGNGHGMMMELNHREALRVILDWIDVRLS